MSAVHLEIKQALELRVAEVLGPVVGMAQVAFPNEAFTPTAGTPWARVHHLWARTAPGTVGVEGYTRRPGVFQVSLHFPFGTGEKAAVTAAQAVVDGFKPGTSLPRGDTTVRVQSASLAPGLRDAEWWVVPVSVWWLVHSVG